MIKIAVGMIVFNGAGVIKECIESLYACPNVHKIIVSEGPVEYFYNNGFVTSTDGTNEILDNFPDPEKKLIVKHGHFAEKTESCRNWFAEVPKDTDYVLCVDSDEIHKPEDLTKLCEILEQEKYTSVGFRSETFFGGFDYILTGFEQGAEFKRMFKYYPSSYYLEHRPPTFIHNESNPLPDKHLDMDTLDHKYNIRMCHYSYVFPNAVKEKIRYYKDRISMSNCIDNYFERIWLPWVKGNDKQKHKIEQEFRGVHEFIPEYRGDCYPKKFTGTHPQSILNNFAELKQKFNQQLEIYELLG